MTKIIIATRLILLLPMLCVGSGVAFASEVTGTLSTSIDQTTTGGGSETTGILDSTVDGNTLGGTVTDGNGSGGSSSSGGGNRTTRTQNGNGQVLGLSDSRTGDSPAFPNAGFDPNDDDEDDLDIWETLFALATISFLAYAGVAYRPKQY